MPQHPIQIGGIDVPRENVLQAPAALLVTGEDRLRVVTRNSLASVVVTLSGRFLPVCGGRPLPFVHTHTPATDRTVGSSDFSLGDGWLLGATVIVSTAAPVIGQTWVQLQLIRGAGGATIVLQTLASGYVTASQPVAWPGSPLAGTLEGQGAVRVVTGTNPAAGVEISETVPTGARWLLIGISATFTTDATVANRTPGLILDDGATPLFGASQGVVQSASLGLDHAWGAGFGTNNTTLALSNSQSLPEPCAMLAGFRVRTSVLNLQAGDDWSSPVLLIREWLEGE